MLSENNVINKSKVGKIKRRYVLINNYIIDKYIY